VSRRILPLALCLVLVGLLAPGAVRAANGWSVSASTDLVQADFISTSGSQAQLYMEDHVSIEPFNIPEAGAVLDALGFGGGYSQEVSWGSGAGPAVSCPKGLTDLFSFCSTDASGGWALIPDGLRTELALSATASGSRALDVRPSLRSLAYDGTVAAIGIALETLSPGPIGSNAAQVASLAVQLLPEAAGFEAAMERKDYTAAGFELLSLSKRAMTIIDDHVTQWAIGGIVDLIPGLAEVKLGIAVSKAIVVLGNLDTHLLAGYSVATVSVVYAGGGGANGSEPSPIVTPVSTPGAFHLTGSMEGPRAEQMAVRLADGRVLVLGGAFNNTVLIKSAEIYDPASGSFTSVGDMMTPRIAATATLLRDGRVLVAGGWTGSWTSDSGGPTASAEIFDPVTGSFAPTGSMSVIRDAHTATLLRDGRVLITGGWAGYAVTSSEIYDPATGRFTPTGSMQTGRSEHGAALLADGSVLVSGGRGGNSAATATATAEIWSPATGTWTAAGEMSAPRASETMTVLQDGRVLVTGGEGPGPVIDSAEIFDPHNWAFEMTGSMGTPRFQHTATLLPDGTVLIAGGQTGRADWPASTELYDPATGVFTPAPPMTTPRLWGTASLLATGQVLMVGGEGTSGTLASAELYP
jgi:Galactose oxidase, central domain